MTTETPELKPCPFCGGEARIVEGEESAYVQCQKVKMHFAIYYDGDNNAANEVAEQWNRRSAASAEPAVAWTGSGSLKELKAGRAGFIYPDAAVAHPVPLYAAPSPSPVVSEAMVQRGINALNDAMASHPPTIVTKDGVAIIHPQTAAAAMRAALNAALSPAPAGEVGWRVVPAELTETMLCKFDEVLRIVSEDTDAIASNPEEVWRAVLAVAPLSASPTGGDK